MAQNQTPDPGGVSRRGLLKAGALAAVAAPAAAWQRSVASGPGGVPGGYRDEIHR